MAAIWRRGVCRRSKAGLPWIGLSRVGLPKAGLSKAGLSRVGLPEAGLFRVRLARGRLARGRLPWVRLARGLGVRLAGWSQLRVYRRFGRSHSYTFAGLRRPWAVDLCKRAPPLVAPGRPTAQACTVGPPTKECAGEMHVDGLTSQLGDTRLIAATRICRSACLPGQWGRATSRPSVRRR